MSNSRGILIMAFSHPYYGRMALNLAVSIKYTEPTMPICLVHSGDALNHLGTYDLPKYFDQMISVDPVTDWISYKTKMYDLSPFDETIFLDADMLWLPKQKPSEAFELFNKMNLDFTIANREYADLATGEMKTKFWQWAEPADVKRAYDFHGGQYYSMHSEFVYFKKTEENSEYFNWVKEIYLNPLVQTKPFAGGVADEFAFAIASIICNRYPHSSPFTPSYWRPAEKSISYTEMIDKFYLYSIGGNENSESVKGQYNRLAKFYFNKMGLLHPYEAKNKKRFIKERQTV